MVALAKVDEALDELLYRPAVVKAFAWLPRWWLCDLAKLSIRLDTRWGTAWWNGELEPGEPCQACRRRASIHIYGGPDPDPDPDDEEDVTDYLTTRPIQLCGWCSVGGPIDNDADLGASLPPPVRIQWRGDGVGGSVPGTTRDRPTGERRRRRPDPALQANPRPRGRVQVKAMA